MERNRGSLAGGNRVVDEERYLGIAERADLADMVAC